MNVTKIGRNDPCPCGSGKKYKRCCQGLEGMVDLDQPPFVRYSQLISSLKVKLDGHYETQIRKLRKPLQERFMRAAAAPVLPREQESLFSDWLWFDMTDRDGMSFGGEYLQDNGSFMDEPLRDCLQACNSSYLSLYEALGMETDHLRVRDFLSGQESLVLLKESLDMDMGEHQLLLLGRLVTFPLGQVFSGMVLMLKNDDGQGNFVRRHIDYWRSLSGSELPLLLKQHGEILFGLCDRANHKTYLPLNEIRVVRDPQKIKRLNQALEDSTDWKLVHVTDAISWYDLHNSQGYTRLGVHPEFAVCHADLLDDILRVQDICSDLFPAEDWEIVNSLFLFQPPAAEMEKIWYAAIKDRETERWLQTPHQELDGHTPREIMDEADGRERLRGLLNAFASQAARNEYSQDLIDYMRLRIQ